MEWTGFSLESLTITINELCPKIKAALQHEIEMRKLSTSGGWSLLTYAELAARKLKWEEDEGEGAAQWINEPFAFSETETIRSFQGVLVKKLIIDGTSMTNELDHLILPNGKLRVTNATAKLVKKLLNETGIQPLEIEFIGELGGTHELTDVEIGLSQDTDSATGWDTYTPEAFWPFL